MVTARHSTRDLRVLIGHFQTLTKVHLTRLKEISIEWCLLQLRAACPANLLSFSSPNPALLPSRTRQAAPVHPTMTCEASHTGAQIAASTWPMPTTKTLFTIQNIMDTKTMQLSTKQRIKHRRPSTQRVSRQALSEPLPQMQPQMSYSQST